MPQMAPLWWSTLFIMFIMSTIMMSKMSFFLMEYKSSFKNEEGMGMMTVSEWKW